MTTTEQTAQPPRRILAADTSPASAGPDGRDATNGGSRSPDPRHLADAELRAWKAFLLAHAAVTRRLESELDQGVEMPLAHYDVLIQLAMADDSRLRMHELADRVLLSRSGITRLVDRLEHQGLVERQHCASDARGAFAVLTPAGRRRVRDATPTHLEGVRRHFLDALEPGDLEHLTATLERIVERAS